MRYNGLSITCKNRRRPVSLTCHRTTPTYKFLTKNVRVFCQVDTVVMTQLKITLDSKTSKITQTQFNTFTRVLTLKKFIRMISPIHTHELINLCL